MDTAPMAHEYSRRATGQAQDDGIIDMDLDAQLPSSTSPATWMSPHPPRAPATSTARPAQALATKRFFQPQDTPSWRDSTRTEAILASRRMPRISKTTIPRSSQAIEPSLVHMGAPAIAENIGGRRSVVEDVFSNVVRQLASPFSSQVKSTDMHRFPGEEKPLTIRLSFDQRTMRYQHAARSPSSTTAVTTSGMIKRLDLPTTPSLGPITSQNSSRTVSITSNVNRHAVTNDADEDTDPFAMATNSTPSSVSSKRLIPTLSPSLDGYHNDRIDVVGDDPPTTLDNSTCTTTDESYRRLFAKTMFVRTVPPPSDMTNVLLSENGDDLWYEYDPALIHASLVHHKRTQEARIAMAKRELERLRKIVN